MTPPAHQLVVVLEPYLQQVLMVQNHHLPSRICRFFNTQNHFETPRMVASKVNEDRQLSDLPATSR